MSEPIRILNLFTVMNRGGAETMVMNYYRKMDKSRIQFDFMVHRQERGAYDDEIESMGGHIYRMCPIYPQYILQYRHLLKEFFDIHSEYRIVHSHMSELGYFAFKEAKLHHIPIRICHAHNAPVFKYETWMEKLKHIPRKWLARKMRNLSTDYFTCSQVAGEWLFGKKNINKLQFMPNAIDAKNFVYTNERTLNAKKLFGWEDKIVVGHVGRFDQQKNHSFLIDIFYIFHQECPQSILVLVGKGELMQNIEKKVCSLGLGNSVFFMGSRSDMPQLYWAFDLFLFPSFYEGLPVSLIEAQAAGLPCVVSDRISKQTKVIPAYFECSLQATALEWAEKMKSILLRGQRHNTLSLIKGSGFDIDSNVEWLSQFYIDLKSATYRV